MCQKHFSELDLRGVQIVSGSCGSLFPTIWASQRPYNEKNVPAHEKWVVKSMGFHIDQTRGRARCAHIYNGHFTL